MQASSSSPKHQNKIIVTVIQIIIVTLACFVLAHLIAQIRIPNIISSSILMIQQLPQLSIKEKIFEFARTYFIYEVIVAILMICCYFIMMKALKLSRISAYKLKQEYTQRYFGLIIIFLAFFYLLFCYFTYKNRMEYTTLYEDFKSGSIQKNYMGYKMYHFQNHYQQTKNNLVRLSASSDQQQKALIQSLTDEVKKQNNSFQGFRGYLANYNLVFKICNDFYEFFGFVMLFLVLIILLIQKCCILSGSNNGQYGSLSNIEYEQNSQAELANCPQNTMQTGCCSLLFFIIFLAFICLIIAANFVVAETILELKIGHPYSNNLEQKQVCSFHRTQVGLFINIDYQIELRIQGLHKELNSRFSNQQQQEIKDSISLLNKQLTIYQNLCQNVGPYFKRHKYSLQQLAKVFYAHFFAFSYVLWKFDRFLIDMK